MSDYINLTTLLCGAVLLFVLYLGAKRLWKKFWTAHVHVLVVSVDGVIKYDAGEDGRFEQIASKLCLIREHQPKAAVIRINSPGGTVGATQELFALVNSIKQKGVYVVALMEDVAASGGLYLSMAADHIVAHGGTITGSIGAIMQNWDVSGLMKTIKVGMNTVKSGKFKDILSPTRPMEADEASLLAGFISDGHRQFCAVVAKARKLEPAVVESFADGRIMTGDQALALGLIDESGSFESALDHIARKLGIKRHNLKTATVEASLSLTARLKHSLLSSQLGALLPATLANRGLTGIPLWLMRQ